VANGGRPRDPRIRIHAHSRPAERGQSLVEFAITLPVVLLMVLFGIDFGRVYLGWVTLNNAAREAANFASINPTAWTGAGSLVAQAEYARLINDESAAINCTLPSPLPDPAFPSGTDVGSPAVVAITCQFTLLTPLIGGILGSPLNVTAATAFPIRSGAIAGTGGGGGPLPSIGPVLPTSDPSQSIPPATPSPDPNCLVPNLVQGNLKTDEAIPVWIAAGFQSNNLLFSPLVPPHYDIKDQSLGDGRSVPCTSSMTVYDKKQ